MSSFFVLVLDKYAEADPDAWVYSATRPTLAELEGLACYDDPPHELPKARFNGVTVGELSLPPCAGGSPDHGVIYEVDDA